MDKILFIVSPNIQNEDFFKPSYNVRIVRKGKKDFGSVLTDMPIGVLSMSSFLKKHLKVETKLIDFNVTLNEMKEYSFGSFSELFESTLLGLKQTGYNPDIVGISTLFTSAYQNMLAIAKYCRKNFPFALILAGGGVPTNMYKNIFQDSRDFDALCYGEGEKPLLKLLTFGDKKKYLDESPSWITRTKVEKNLVFKHDFLSDLDEIPFYDYGLFEKDKYSLNPAITAYAGVAEKKQNFHVMTSRGCTFRCIFCSSHTVHGRKMRYFSLKRVKEDLIRLRDEFGARVIVFQDDHLLADKERAHKIIHILKKLGLASVFQNGLALYALDRRMLLDLKSAGVDSLLLSIESGSSRVLKEIMHKPLDLKVVKRVAEDCRELEIYSSVNILIGLPGETKKDIEEAISFLKTLDANWFLVFCANPLVGSEMFDICVKKNYLKGEYIGSDYKKAVVETEDFTAEYIQETAYRMNLELNFVYNSDLRLLDYKTALKGFENAIKAKNDHALAYYYASKCYAALGEKDKAKKYLELAKKFSKLPFWQKYVKLFKIPIENPD